MTPQPQQQEQYFLISESRFNEIIRLLRKHENYQDYADICEGVVRSRPSSPAPATKGPCKDCTDPNQCYTPCFPAPASTPEPCWLFDAEQIEVIHKALNAAVTPATTKKETQLICRAHRIILDAPSIKHDAAIFRADAMLAENKRVLDELIECSENYYRSYMGEGQDPWILEKDWVELIDSLRRHAPQQEREP